MAIKAPGSPTRTQIESLSLFSDFNDDLPDEVITKIARKHLNSPSKRSELFQAHSPKSPSYTLPAPRFRKLAQPLFPTSPTGSPERSRLTPQSTPTSAAKRGREVFESLNAPDEAKDTTKKPFQAMVPKPDFSAFGLGSSSPKKAPPPAPSKKSRSALVSRFREQYTNLGNNEFKMHGQPIQVTYLAEGTYSSVYTLEKNTTPIILGVDNSTLVLKAFHGKNAKFHDLSMAHTLQNAIDNYNAIVALELPVARIYNASTAVQDGYILQQKVSEKIDPLNPDHVKQVRTFFEASVRQRVVMDLLPQNFAVENGMVVLIDFVEEPEDGIDIFNKKACELWIKLYKSLTREQIAAIMKELTAGHYQEFIGKFLGGSV